MTKHNEPQHQTQAAAALGLDIGGLETVYDRLAEAIDKAGPDKTQLFLAKLALLSAQALGDAAHFERLAAEALRDL